MHFHLNNGLVNVSHCYVIRALPLVLWYRIVCLPTGIKEEQTQAALLTGFRRWKSSL